MIQQRHIPAHTTPSPLPRVTRIFTNPRRIYLTVNRRFGIIQRPQKGEVRMLSVSSSHAQSITPRARLRCIKLHQNATRFTRKPRFPFPILSLRPSSPLAAWLHGYLASPLASEHAKPRQSAPNHATRAPVQKVRNKATCHPVTPHAPQKPTPRHKAPQLRAPAQNEPTQSVIHNPQSAIPQDSGLPHSAGASMSNPLSSGRTVL
jgi:hypothetical protein